MTVDNCLPSLTDARPTSGSDSRPRWGTILQFAVQAGVSAANTAHHILLIRA
jgi:hypothetical protein